MLSVSSSNLPYITVMGNTYKVDGELCDKARRLLSTMARADQSHTGEGLGRPWFGT